MSRPTRTGSAATQTYSSSEWAKTALANAIQQSPLTYTDIEVDTFYEWIAAHYNNHPQNGSYCFAAEVRKEWPRSDFEQVLTLNDLTVHDVMYTIMSEYAEKGPIAAPLPFNKFNDNKFVDDPTQLCPLSGVNMPNSMLTVGLVLQRYNKSGDDGGTGGGGGNGGNKEDTNATPFYKSIWFWLLVVIILLVVVAATSKK